MFLSVSPSFTPQLVAYVLKGMNFLDCVEKEMRQEHLEILDTLLKQAEADAQPEDFRRYGSARELYHFKIDNAADY